MLRYGSGSVPIATGWKCTNCHRTHRSSIPRSASGNTRARPELTTGTSRPLPNWSAPCPGSSERCKTILSRSDPICFLFVDRHVLLIMRGCIGVACCLGLILAGPAFGAVVSYQITLNTASVSGTTGYIDFQLDPGSLGALGVTAQIFAFTGGTLSTNTTDRK